MRQYKRLLFFYAPIFWLLSCNSTVKDEPANAKDDTFRSYTIDASIGTTSVFDIIESIEFLGLEETKESLLGYVFRTIHSEKHIVFKNGHEDELLIYSEQGKFLKKINSKGGGPEEYASIRSFWLKSGLIEVFDGRRVVSYDLDGNFAKSALAKEFGLQVSGVEDGYVTDVSRSPVDGSSKFKLAFLNNQFERETLAIPYEMAKKTAIVWLTTPFSYYEDDLLYQHPNGDTIYKLNSKMATPLLSIDFGEKWIWKDKDIYNDLQKQRLLIRENEAYSMFFMKVSEKLVFIKARKADKFLLNRKTGNYRKVSFDKKGGGSYIVQDAGWDEDRMVFCLSSGDLVEFIERLGKEKASAKLGSANLEAIEASENPVLIWVKFKTEL